MPRPQGTKPAGLGWWEVVAFGWDGKVTHRAEVPRNEAERLAERWFARPEIERVEVVKR